ncbi:hypothetical protein F5Y12DRAFT_270848 [Xylaria sp. FL1777]|nr:hypothetical protein F5Y12DRAFT_270848 [Xylaria sp. FL1777]
MPRVLPWKRRERQAFELPKSARSSPVPRVKQEDTGRSQDEEDAVSPSNAAVITKRISKRPRQSTSTSPPPEPPQENFMIEGIDGDDRYRMVEDEFLATAQQFTAHLHAAEYKRLKTASELENAQTIRNISRPVVGQMTGLVKIKQERKTLAEKQQLATRKLLKRDAGGDESTGTDNPNDSWQKQSLYGLMQSPGKQAQRLNGLPSATSVTRAAAGFNRKSDAVSPSQLKAKSRAPSDATDRHNIEGDNFPETVNSYRMAHRSPRPVPTTSGVAAPRTPEVSKPLPDSSYTATENPISDQPRAAETTTVNSDDDDMDFMARLKKRQDERRRIRGQRKSTNSEAKSNLGDILPDFL